MTTTLPTLYMIPHSNKTPYPTVPQKRNWPWIPNYYPPNYVPEEEDSAPSLVNNLVPPPVEDQEKNGEGTNKNNWETEDKELEDIQDKDKKITEEDSD